LAIIFEGTTAGRLLGSVLILLGIVFFHADCEFFSVFLSQQEDKISRQELDNKPQLFMLQQKN
jgi:hypothetical protein